MANFGVMLPTFSAFGTTFDIDAPIEIARWVDGTEYESVWVGDHIVHPSQFLESMTILAMVAAETHRVRLGPCVLLLPMRQLIIIARQVATLAVMSRGRLLLGVGLGGEFPTEWEAAGVPLAERGRRLDESVVLLRQLLRGDPVDADGRFTTLNSVRIQPAPGDVPLLFGGRSMAALRRAAILGDGWIGFMQTPTGYRRALSTMTNLRADSDAAADAFSRSLLVSFAVDTAPGDALQRATAYLLQRTADHRVQTSPERLREFIVAGTPEQMIDRLGEFVDAGCETFIMNPVAEGRAGADQLAHVAAEVIPHLRTATPIDR